MAVIFRSPLFVGKWERSPVHYLPMIIPPPLTTQVIGGIIPLPLGAANEIPLQIEAKWGLVPNADTSHGTPKTLGADKQLPFFILQPQLPVQHRGMEWLNVSTTAGTPKSLLADKQLPFFELAPQLPYQHRGGKEWLNPDTTQDTPKGLTADKQPPLFVAPHFAPGAQPVASRLVVDTSQESPLALIGFLPIPPGKVAHVGIPRVWWQPPDTSASVAKALSLDAQTPFAVLQQTPPYLIRSVVDTSQGASVGLPSPITKQSAVAFGGNVRNLFTFTEQFDNATWTKTHASITADATSAPDGTNTADKIVEDATTNLHTIGQAVTLQTFAVYLASIHGKAAERSWIVARLTDIGGTTRRAWFNLSTGVVGTHDSGLNVSIVAVGGGYYRCLAQQSAGSGSPAAVTQSFGLADADNSDTYAGDGTSGAFLWGAQYEQSALPGNPYQAMPTVGGAFSAVGNLLSVLPPGEFAYVQQIRSLWQPRDTSASIAKVLYGDLTPALFNLSYPTPHLVRSVVDTSQHTAKTIADAQAPFETLQQTAPDRIRPVVDTSQSSRSLVLGQTRGSVAFAGAGSFTAAAKELAQSVAAFSGVGAFSDIGASLVAPMGRAAPFVQWIGKPHLVYIFAPPNLLGTTLARVNVNGSSAFVGAGAFAVTAKELAAAQASFVGAGAFAVTDTRLLAPIRSTLSTSWVEKPRLTFVFAPPNLLATTLGNINRVGSATFVGSGAFAPVGKTLAKASIQFAGAGVFAAIGKELAASVATWSGIGSLSVTGKTLFKGVVNFGGSGSLVAVAKEFAASRATFGGVGAFAAVGREIAASVATVTGHGAFTFVASEKASAVAALHGTGTFVAVGSTLATGQSVAAFAGRGTFAAAGKETDRGTVSFAGAGNFAAQSPSVPVPAPVVGDSAGGYGGRPAVGFPWPRPRAEERPTPKPYIPQPEPETYVCSSRTQQVVRWKTDAVATGGVLPRTEQVVVALTRAAAQEVSLRVFAKTRCAIASTSTAFADLSFGATYQNAMLLKGQTSSQLHDTELDEFVELVKMINDVDDLERLAA